MNEETQAQEELPGMVTVGERLRDARKAKDLEIDDIASRTRIPKRHLENLEQSNWDRLPAPTYTMGFAKAYASEVGLDKEEIAAQLRTELDDLPPAPVEDGYEVADPARSFPRWIIWVALLALVGAIAWFIYSNERTLGDTDGEDQELLLDPEEERQAALEQADRVLLIANSPVDIRITDGDEVLTEQSLATGQSYVVPADAQAPMLAVNDAGALRIAVGTADVPPIGEAGQSANGISLLGSDLLADPAEAQAAAEPAPAAAPPPASRPTARRSSPPPQRRAQTPPPAPRPQPSATRPADSPTSNENDTPSVQFDDSAPPPPPLEAPGDNGGDSAAD
ncbi:helix-turn-helix domain-containing protein [Sphingomicrobium clamense]|uniref:Helix-turn-helix domain-containing protein n=1 Tax=Sphingomicrobium clamense TaxID=2851013 RepID=A0ABS6V419_9SPHN|nr:helix-turn-helix domain-containing protein [Sphingomicrobium sp. B8]MBW0144300.1 helix-turn-helix domain-containing protein [Sphingomicrobium sp. B8]